MWGIHPCMSGLGLDETEARMFQNAASGYGVEVVGGTPEARERALREHLDGPFVAVDCRDFDDKGDILRHIITESVGEDIAENAHISMVNVERALGESGRNILFLEFDALPSDTQTDIAQFVNCLGVKPRGLSVDSRSNCVMQ